jgi:hypothetical protein
MAAAVIGQASFWGEECAAEERPQQDAQRGSSRPLRAHRAGERVKTVRIHEGSPFRRNAKVNAGRQDDTVAIVDASTGQRGIADGSVSIG